ncbi:MAG: hypothetical protein KUG78_02505 [Kangiellaceae bacterium]|nr:hypothetical protein [Kangiellaceae bacterium]
METTKIKGINDFLISLVVVLVLSGCVSIGHQPTLEEALVPSPTSKSSILISAELLRLDVEQLVKKTIEIHPDAFSVISKAEFLKQAETIKNSLQYPLTKNAFFLRIAPLLTKLRDIHSVIQLPKEMPMLVESLENESTLNRLFPLAVLYEKNALYVAADLSSVPHVPVGAVIEAVNDMPIEFLLSKMRQLTPAETEPGIRRKIQIDFPWLLAVMGYSQKNYHVRYRWQEKSHNVVMVGLKPLVSKTAKEQPIEVVDLVANNESLNSETGLEQSVSDELGSGAIIESSSTSSFYGFSQLNQSTALLWFNDFNEDPIKFEEFVELRFAEYRNEGIENLIIDVRYNDGGLSHNIKKLLSYLTSQPISWSEFGEIKVSEPLRELHQQKTKQRRKSKFSWGIHWLPLEWTDMLQYELSWSAVGESVRVNFEPIEPTDFEPPTNIKILSNGFCFSACAAFIAAVNKNQLAEVIGETAGSIAKVQYVYPIETQLEHSKLLLLLPTTKVFFDAAKVPRNQALSSRHELVSPKIAVERTAEQIINRQDAILNTALQRSRVLPQ